MYQMYMNIIDNVRFLYALTITNVSHNHKLWLIFNDFCYIAMILLVIRMFYSVKSILENILC